MVSNFTELFEHITTQTKENTWAFKKKNNQHRILQNLMAKVPRFFFYQINATKPSKTAARDIRAQTCIPHHVASNNLNGSQPKTKIKDYFFKHHKKNKP